MSPIPEDDRTPPPPQSDDAGDPVTTALVDTVQQLQQLQQQNRLVEGAAEAFGDLVTRVQTEIDRRSGRDRRKAPRGLGQDRRQGG